MTDFNVDYFLAKCEAIPEQGWCIGTWTDPKGRHCAAGHCGESNGHSSSKSIALANLARRHGYEISDINDGECEKYQQPTPKQRILAALRDIKAGQK